MNILNRIFCRTYQKAFWLVYPLLPYREPTMIDDGIKGIPELLRKENKYRPLIITDSTIYKLGIADKIFDELKKNRISYSTYTNVVPNPTSENVEESVRIYKRDRCDAIIGFGGGSSMDTAKAVGARISNPKKSLDKMKGLLKVRRRLPLLIAIPTTAGTGSEATLASVIVDSNTRHKYVINDFPLIPHYAVLDPEVTRSLPKSITAETGMDALTHAIEAYIGKSNHRMTKIEAKIAVRLIFANLEKAYDDGNDMNARKHLLRASYLAGCSFTRSYVGYVHSIAHSLGGKYNIPHGRANAIILPYMLERYGSAATNKLYKLSIAAGTADELMSKEEGARRFIEAIKEMNKKFGIPSHFNEIKKEDIKELAKYANKEGNPLYPVPLLMDAKELEKMYYILSGVNNG